MICKSMEEIMEHFYSTDQNVQMLIALLKSHNIKIVIASPGTGNMQFIGSIQQDSFFTVYSCVDERSAAYMACGIVSETNKPVVLSCTGATASRNYFPALTEAFYRKLPILVVTAGQRRCNDNNLIPQYVNRTRQPLDTVKKSLYIQAIKDKDDLWNCNLKLNQAILDLFSENCGPIHLDMEGEYNASLSVKKLPNTKIIRRFYSNDNFPALPKGKRIAIMVGAHLKFDDTLTKYVDSFCKKYNAVVFTDHTSGYYGKYGILASLIAAQEYYNSPIFNLDILIHMGEQCGDYYLAESLTNVKQIWRIDITGELKDPYRKLKYVFQMTEKCFFESYCDIEELLDIPMGESYYDICRTEIEKINDDIPKLPFSNIWIAQNSVSLIPKNATIYLSILNSLRAWNFFEFPHQNHCFSNVGGFGIDGGLSTLFGASLVDKDKLYFCIAGDLQFFYDMNSCGNHHINNNVRILLINNGKGTEFRLYSHGAQQMLGDDADDYIAAKGHFGNQSPKVVKNFVESLGFEYICAKNKNEYYQFCEYFFSPSMVEKSIVFEVFTNSEDESKALKKIRNIRYNKYRRIKASSKNIIKAKIKSSKLKIVKDILQK